MEKSRYIIYYILALPNSNSGVTEVNIVKKQRILSYFKAWETKDMTLMKEVLTPHNFGLRTFLETIHVSFDTIQKELEVSLIKSYKVISIDNM